MAEACAGACRAAELSSTQSSPIDQCQDDLKALLGCRGQLLLALALRCFHHPWWIRGLAAGHNLTMGMARLPGPHGHCNTLHNAQHRRLSSSHRAAGTSGLWYTTRGCLVATTRPPKVPQTQILFWRTLFSLCPWLLRLTDENNVCASFAFAYSTWCWCGMAIQADTVVLAPTSLAIVRRCINTVPH